MVVTCWPPSRRGGPSFCKGRTCCITAMSPRAKTAAQRTTTKKEYERTNETKRMTTTRNDDERSDKETQTLTPRRQRPCGRATAPTQRSTIALGADVVVDICPVRTSGFVKVLIFDGPHKRPDRPQNRQLLLLLLLLEVLLLEVFLLKTSRARHPLPSYAAPNRCNRLRSPARPHSFPQTRPCRWSPCPSQPPPSSRRSHYARR